MTAGSATEGADQIRRDTGNPNSDLPTMIQNWPTPTARDWKDTGNLENVPENGLLGRVAMNWTTPRASDGEKGGPNQSFGAGGIPLAAQTQQWMTPRVSETGQYQYNNGNKDNPVLTLQGQAQASDFRSILPDRPISTVGEESSPIRRTLNPLFVEWLMAWPPGWTSQALTAPERSASGAIIMPASNGSACSATALSRYRQRMRFELCALGLPPEAAPAQLGLFQ